MTDEALDRITMMSEEAAKHTFTGNIAPDHFSIRGHDGRELMRLNFDGTVTGEIEDAGEAARVFVETVRRMMGEKPL